MNGASSDAARFAFVQEELQRVQALATPAVSDYHVGAVVFAEQASGEIVHCAGANLELSGFPLALTVHAEQAALHQAALRGFTRIHELWVTAPPCGHCRQFLLELAPESRPVVKVATSEGAESFQLADLLPLPFDATALGKKPQWFAEEGSRPNLLEQEWGTLEEVARAAYARSHAPYTDNRVGVALKWSDGSVDLGLRVESVAFNPSLWAFLGALSSAALRGQKVDLEQLREVCVVESQSLAAEGQLVQSILHGWALDARMTHVLAAES